MLSMHKTIELLGSDLTQAQAEEIRGFAYELADILFEATTNYKVTNQNQNEENITRGGAGLGTRGLLP
jgi:hypothetical protein